MTLAEDIERAYRAGTLADVTLHVTTTQLATLDLPLHRAMLDLPHLDPLLDTSLTPAVSRLPPAPPAQPADLHANVSHARLSDLRAALDHPYTDRDAVSARLRHLLQSGEHADCTVAVEDNDDPTSSGPSARVVSAPAHRFVLAARCPYFATLFDSGFADALSPTLALPLDVFASPVVFDAVMHYIYTDALPAPPPANPRACFDLYRAANFLAMDSLQEHLIGLLTNDLMHGLETCTCPSCTANAPSVLLFADRMGITSVRSAAVALFATHPRDLWPSLEFAASPRSVREAVLREFTEQAERDPSALLQGIVTLDALLETMAPRVTHPAFATLVDAVAASRDALVPQLIPALPAVLAVVERPPTWDISARLAALDAHLPALYSDRVLVPLAFALFTAHLSRVARAATASPDHDTGAPPLDAAVTAAIGALVHSALAYYAKRWINIPLTPPRGVYPGGEPWKAFVDAAAAEAGVAVDEIQMMAANAASTSSSSGGSVVGGFGSVARVAKVASLVMRAGRPVSVVGGIAGSDGGGSSRASVVVGSRSASSSMASSSSGSRASVVGGNGSAFGMAGLAAVLGDSHRSGGLVRSSGGGSVVGAATARERPRSTVVASASGAAINRHSMVLPRTSSSSMSSTVLSSSQPPTGPRASVVGARRGSAASSATTLTSSSMRSSPLASEGSVASTPPVVRRVRASTAAPSTTTSSTRPMSMMVTGAERSAAVSMGVPSARVRSLTAGSSSSSLGSRGSQPVVVKKPLPPTPQQQPAATASAGQTSAAARRPSVPSASSSASAATTVRRGPFPTAATASTTGPTTVSASLMRPTAASAARARGKSPAPPPSSSSSSLNAASSSPPPTPPKKALRSPSRRRSSVASNMSGTDGDNGPPPVPPVPSAADAVGSRIAAAFRASMASGGGPAVKSGRGGGMMVAAGTAADPDAGTTAYGSRIRPPAVVASNNNV
ncbi:hypothetical protein BC828DRAFT_375507 [Blastocladiella britannica]|nr:hypothetical protein BC828DRAFT_375507 [Blastocladiella britannica]